MEQTIKHKTGKTNSDNPSFKSTGSVFTDTIEMVRAMQGDVHEKNLTPNSHGKEHGIGLHEATSALGAVLKAAHYMKEHLPHPLHTIEKIGEITSEVVHENHTHVSVENVVCGSLSGVAKVVTGGAIAAVAIEAVPALTAGSLLEAPLVNIAAGGAVGIGAQKVIEAVVKPVGDVVNQVCHGSFSMLSSILDVAQKEQKDIESSIEKPLSQSESSFFENLNFISSAVASEPCLEENKNMYGFNPKRTADLEAEKARLKARYQRSNLTEAQTKEFDWALDKHLYDPSSKTAAQMAGFMKQQDALKSLPTQPKANFSKAQTAQRSVKTRKTELYRGHDITNRLNQDRRPWVSHDYLRELENALSDYFERESSQAQQLFKRFIPSFAFKNKEDAQTVFEHFKKDAAEVFAKLYPASELSAVDKKAFMEHYFSSLLEPGHNGLPQDDFTKALNQTIAESPKYERTREMLKDALPKNTPTPDPNLEQFSSYAKQTAQYAQAVNLLSVAGMMNRKTGETANKIFMGATAIGSGAEALAAGGFSLGPAALVITGGLVCMSVLADALRDDDDDRPGPDPVMLALEAQARQIFELTRLCAAMYKDVMDQFKYLNEKLDGYHLDHVKRFLELWLASEHNHANVLDYMHRYHTVLSNQLQEVQRILPDIKDACHQLRLQSISQHLEIMANFRILHVADDRRLVTEVRNRIAEHEALHEEISLEELNQYTLSLQCAATRETKEPHLTQANLSTSFLEREHMAPWVRDIDVIERSFVLPIASASTAEEGEVVATHCIGFLQRIGLHTSNYDTRCKDKILPHPLLLLDRGTALMELLQAYKKQNPHHFFPEYVRVRLEAIIKELETLQIFYDFDLESQIKDDLKPAIQADLESFNKETSRIQKDFYKEKFLAARREQLAILRQDMTLNERNIRYDIHFKTPVEWDRFYYRFGYERYGNFWVYHNTPPVGRRYIYNDILQNGELISLRPIQYQLRCRERWARLGDSFSPWNPLFQSCFQTALYSFPWSQHIPGGNGEKALTDAQVEAEYSDTWSSLHSAYISFDEFVEELLEGSNSRLEPDSFRKFLKKLHDFDKEGYQVSHKEAYLVTHYGDQDQLKAAEASCKEEIVLSDALVLRPHLTKPLPMRLAKPKEGSKALVSQGLLINLESLSLHPSLRELENRGVGYIDVAYDIHALDRSDYYVHQLAFTLEIVFKPYDPVKPTVTLCTKTISPIRYSSVYSIDEIVFLLWYDGRYISGETHDLSCTMISNTQPVPAFDKQHPKLLSQLDIKLDINLNHLVAQDHQEWQRVMRGRLMDALTRSTEPLRHVFKRLEANVACLKAYCYLLHHNDPSIKAFVEQPNLAYFTETGLRQYISTRTELNIEGNYEAYYYDLIDGPLSKLTIPAHLKHPKIEALLYEARYFHGIAKSDQFIRHITETRAANRLAYDTLIAEIKEKQEKAEVALSKVSSRHREDERILQEILYGNRLLAKTGIIPWDGLLSLEDAFEELGGLLIKESLADEHKKEEDELIADLLREKPCYNREGLFPILLKYWTENKASEDIYKAIELVLKNKRGSVKSLVNEVDSTTGKTPLHLACAQGSIDLIKLLLREEANITLQDRSDKLCWEYAPIKEKDAYRALIETRGSWQAKAKDLGFSFNRALWLIEQAMRYFSEVGDINVPGVLLVGPTRAGKSTLMNAVLGTRYQRVETKRTVKVEPVAGFQEYARVGHQTTSETMHPNIDVGSEYALIDCPGFDETRGLAETICHGVSFHALEEQLESIKGIVLVCDEHDIKHPFVTLRRSLEHVGRMTMALSDEDLAKNVCLMVTKLRDDETLIESLREWLEEDFTDVDADSDEKLWATKRVLRALTSNSEGVIFADVTSVESLEKVRAKIASLHVQSKQQYDFTRPQHELQVFRNFLMQMLDTRQRIDNEQKSLQYGLIRMYFDRLSKETSSFPVSLSVLKEELIRLHEMADIAERLDSSEDTILHLEETETHTVGLDAIRHSLLEFFSVLLDCAANMSAGTEEDLKQALKMRHAELEVNQLFFDQAERISSMIGVKTVKTNSLSPMKFMPTIDIERLRFASSKKSYMTVNSTDGYETDDEDLRKLECETDEYLRLHVVAIDVDDSEDELEPPLWIQADETPGKRVLNPCYRFSDTKELTSFFSNKGRVLNKEVDSVCLQLKVFN